MNEYIVTWDPKDLSVSQKVFYDDPDGVKAKKFAADKAMDLACAVYVSKVVTAYYAIRSVSLQTKEYQ